MFKDLKLLKLTVRFGACDWLAFKRGWLGSLKCRAHAAVEDDDSPARCGYEISLRRAPCKAVGHRAGLL